MQNDVRQAIQALQAGSVIKIGQQRNGPGCTPFVGATGVANQGIDAMALGKTRENAAGNISAADNENILHIGIVAEQSGEEMSYQITVQPSGRQFTAEADETLLDAALRQGLTLPYGCKDGARHRRRNAETPAAGS